MIKFLDIYRQDLKLLDSIYSDIKKIIKKNNFILGNEVSDFEKKFSKFCGSKYSVGCANGTDALLIALKSLSLPANSEVLIPAMTYCSTAFAVINAGLKPVLVDTSYLSPTINIDQLKKKITKKTRVIMPVHLYGSVVDIPLIRKIIKNKRISIIDDCAQAHGGKLNNKCVGSIADISCFSLYPGKNLGAYGDAGIITTNDKNLYKRIRNYRNLGSSEKFMHTQIGVNSRLDTLQAAVLLRKLPSLNLNNNKRKKIARYYDLKINNKNIEKLVYSKGAVYHQYVILSKKREKLIKLLKNNRIQFGFHYPYAIHKLQSLKNFFKKKAYKNAEKLASRGISLPIDPNLSKKNQDKIIKVLNSL